LLYGAENQRPFFVTFVPLVFLRVQVVFRSLRCSRRIQGIRKGFHRQGAKTGKEQLSGQAVLRAPVSPW